MLQRVVLHHAHAGSSKCMKLYWNAATPTLATMGTTAQVSDCNILVLQALPL